jgi:TorA maturation chaperone TorD
MLSGQLLFSRGIEELLCQQPGLEIVGRETDVDRALDCIRRLRPDVVILDSKDLASTPANVVAAIFREAPQARVISLNLENDQIQVYHGERRAAQSIDDLRSVIDEEAARPSAVTPHEWLALAAGRAQVYGFLAASFRRPVDAELLERIGGSSQAVFASLEGDVDLTGDLCEGLHALERFQLQVRQRPSAAVSRELLEEFELLLSASTGGESSLPCEAAYTGLDAPAWAATRAAVSEAYLSGGFCPPDRRPPLPDLIGSELDYMQHLCWHEHQAWIQSSRSDAHRYQSAECAFLKDHLIRWVPRCCDALLARSHHDFYRGVLHLTRGFILNEAYRVAELMDCASPVEHPAPGSGDD